MYVMDAKIKLGAKQKIVAERKKILPREAKRPKKKREILEMQRCAQLWC